MDAEAQPQGVFLENVQAFKEKMQAAGEEAVHLKEMLPSLAVSNKKLRFSFFPSLYLYLKNHLLLIFKKILFPIVFQKYSINVQISGLPTYNPSDLSMTKASTLIMFIII